MTINRAITAWSEVINAAGTAGVSLVLPAGKGTRFQTGAQRTWARVYLASDPGINEIVDITNRATDVLTVTRNADGRGSYDIAATGWAIEVVEDLGPMRNITYDAGFWFSGGGGGTYSVLIGGLSRFAAKRVGYMVCYECVAAGTVAGVVTQINVLFPTEFIPLGAAARGGAWPVTVFEGAGITTAGAFWLAGNNFLSIVKSGGAAFTPGGVNVNFQLWVAIP